MRTHNKATSSQYSNDVYEAAKEVRQEVAVIRNDLHKRGIDNKSAEYLSKVEILQIIQKYATKYNVTMKAMLAVFRGGEVHSNAKVE